MSFRTVSISSLIGCLLLGTVGILNLAKAPAAAAAGHWAETSAAQTTATTTATRRILIPAPPIGRTPRTTQPTTSQLQSSAPKSPAGPTVPSPNPCPARARACVDLTRDISWLQANGKVVYGPVRITSGRPGYLTPPGTFRVFWKHIDHRSSIFGGAPMPYSIFFNGGIAFHQGSVSILSHGCIHLERVAAQKYWAHLRNRDIVYVFGRAPH